MTSGSVWVQRLEPERISLLVDAPTAGWLVVRESWDAQWQATLDGQPVPIVPGDLMYRAIAVPPGRHRVRMVYEVPFRRVGTVVSSLAWLALAGLGAWAGVRHRQRGP